MRKLLIGLTVTTFAGAALLFACSSDDPAPATTAKDAGSDTGPANNNVPDSGSSQIADAGTDAGDGGPTCQTCADFLENGPGALPACENNGPPSSKTLIDNWFTKCVCNKDAGTKGCSTQCADTCSTFAAPSDSCQTCFSSVCSDSLAACAADK